MTVSTYTIGCKVNQYETEAITEIFKEKGFSILPFGKKTDIFLINTCSVTAISESKNRQIIRKYNRLNPNGIIIVMGCYSQLAKEQVASIEGVDIIVGTQDRMSIFSMLDKVIKKKKKTIRVKDIDFKKALDYEDIPIRQFEDHTRAFIKIQDGCNAFCSYCIIPYARGPIRTRPLDSIVKEVKEISKKGYKEVVLVGIHLSAYGMELNDGKTNLQEAVKEISKIDGIERIRLGSLEPMYFNEDVIKSLANNEKLCRHFHLSLQSGSDSVLKRMNRKYSTKEYEAIVDLIRSCMPDASITTDIMVAFPGESQEEFIESMEFVKKIGFARLHVFPYSSRPGTAASKMKGHLPSAVKKKRASLMGQLAASLEEDFAREMVGRECMLLVEDGQCGYTKNYLKVNIEKGDFAKGDIVKVKIKSSNGNESLGIII